jgi:hypothetical protein
MNDSSAGRGSVRGSIVAARCFLRHLPIFFREAPKTPLRVLGIIAFDTLHVLRHSRPLPPARVEALASFMDFEGCANAACDGKAFSEAEYHGILERLERAGFGACVASYLYRLRELESRRPEIAGDGSRFDDVRSYREAVARLSMGTAAAIALVDAPIEEGSRATWRDSDVNALYRVLMQCQVIDDVLDYREDLAAGLPSFLTASASVNQSLDLTAAAVRSYAAGVRSSTGAAAFPLRLALFIVSTAAKLMVKGAWWHRTPVTYAGMVKVKE